MTGAPDRIIPSLRSLTPSGPPSRWDDVASAGCAACGSNLEVRLLAIVQVIKKGPALRTLC